MKRDPSQPDALKHPSLARRVRWLLALLLCLTPAAYAQKLLDQVPAPARDLDIEEHVGAELPLDALFTDADGKQVRLGDYFPKSGHKPAIIALVYYRCPVVCSVVMDKLAETMAQMDLTVGDEYNTLLFSFNPNETTHEALTRREGYLTGYGREITPQVRAGWQFHTSTIESAGSLARALGFRYKRLENGEYSHPVCIFVVTPEGRISRYLYGFSYPPRDIKLALLEASQGKVAKTIGDRLLLFCYHYDPRKGGYTLQAFRVMQVAGVATMLLLGGLVGTLVLGERARRTARARRLAKAEHSPPPPRVVTVNSPHSPAAAGESPMGSNG